MKVRPGHWRKVYVAWKQKMPHDVTLHDVRADAKRYIEVLSRPVRAIRVTRGGLEPSVIAWVLGEFSRQVWQVTSHPKSPRTVGNVAGGIRFCSWLNPRARLDYKLASRKLYFNFISNELKDGKLKTVKRFCSSFFGFRLDPEIKWACLIYSYSAFSCPFFLLISMTRLLQLGVLMRWTHVWEKQARETKSY